MKSATNGRTILACNIDMGFEMSELHSSLAYVNISFRSFTHRSMDRQIEWEGGLRTLGVICLVFVSFLDC